VLGLERQRLLDRRRHVAPVGFVIGRTPRQIPGRSVDHRQARRFVALHVPHGADAAVIARAVGAQRIVAVFRSHVAQHAVGDRRQEFRGLLAVRHARERAARVAPQSVHRVRVLIARRGDVDARQILVADRARDEAGETVAERAEADALHDLARARRQIRLAGHGIAVDRHVQHDAGRNHAVLHAGAVAAGVGILPAHLVGRGQVRQLLAALVAGEIIVEKMRLRLVKAAPARVPRGVGTGLESGFGSALLRLADARAQHDTEDQQTQTGMRKHRAPFLMKRRECRAADKVCGAERSISILTVQRNSSLGHTGRIRWAHGSSVGVRDS